MSARKHVKKCGKTRQKALENTLKSAGKHVKKGHENVKKRGKTLITAGKHVKKRGKTRQ